MKIIEVLRNIIPDIFSVISYILLTIAQIFSGFATIFLSIATTTHMLLDTETGKKLKEVEKTTKAIIDLYTNLAKKVDAQKIAVRSEENKLAKILKEDKNILPLGKKSEDEPSKN